MRARLVGTVMALPTAMTMFAHSKDPSETAAPDGEEFTLSHSVARCDAVSLPAGKDIEKTLVGAFQPLPAREQVWRELAKNGKQFDVLVIGGGATGTGCALDAQTRYVRLQGRSTMILAGLWF